MSLYIEQIRQLVALQGIDDAIRDVEKELKAAPEKLDSLTRDFEAAESLQSKNADKMANLEEQKSRSSADIKEDTDRINKSKAKYGQVSNSREYQAMAREVDGMEKILKTREEAHNSILEEIKIHQTAMDEATAHFEQLKKDVEECRASFDARVQASEKQLEELKNQREKMGENISKPILDRYEFIRNRLPHPVIVSVTDSICNGCHIAIPPQTYIEIQSGQKILNCPNCQRLIYWSEHFASKNEDKKD